MLIIDRIILRHKFRVAQPTVIWEKDQFLEIPEAESVGVLPYKDWLDLFNRLLTDKDLSLEDAENLLKNFQIEKYIPKSSFLIQPLH